MSNNTKISNFILHIYKKIACLNKLLSILNLLYFNRKTGIMQAVYFFIKKKVVTHNNDLYFIK